MVKIMIAIVQFSKSKLRCWRDSKIANEEVLLPEDSKIAFEEVLPPEDL